jgi:hypothetical protein
MRALVAITVFCLLNLGMAPAHGQAPAEPARPAKPKVYMLISAVGEQFTVMFEVSHTGSNLPPYRKTSIAVEKNVLNRLVLHDLDQAIAAIDPDSKRLYLSLRATDMDKAALSERESVALDEILTDLKGMPERMEWDRIVIATPSYKSFSLNGVPGRLAGFGVFYQPLGSRFIFSGDLGEDAVTPEGRFTRARHYAAPFSFIEIWILDAKTLKVLDRQQRFDNIKVYDPRSESLLISQNVSPQVLMKYVSSLIERSVDAAVTHTGALPKRGDVDVGAIKEINQDDVGKPDGAGKLP